LAREIAAVVPGKLDRSAIETARRKKREDLTAYDHFLRARWFLDRDFGAPEGLAHLNEAIRIDPAFARAHAMLADYYCYNHMLTSVLTEDTAKQVRRSAERALELDPTDPVIHAIVAEVYLTFEKHDLARRHNELALKLNANDITVMTYAAGNASHLGEHDRALDLLDRCLRHDPLYGDAFRHAYFHIYYTAKRYQDALDLMEGWSRPPVMVFAEAAAAYAQLGRMGAARQAAARFEANRPQGFDLSAEIRLLVGVMLKEEDKEIWREGFRKAGFQF
jgi:Tfp pilus assembly protein PilF